MIRILLTLAIAGLATGCAGPAGPTALPSGSGGTSAVPEVSIPAGAIVLDAHDFRFSTVHLEGIADIPTVVAFTNHDLTAHNLTIYRNVAQDEELFRGDLISGPNTTIVYEVPALPAGQYYFRCTLHQGMHGTFVVADQPLSSGSP